jgi:hypothetical protein
MNTIRPWVKRASAVLREGKIFIEPISRTVTLWNVSTDPVLISSPDDPDLGLKMLETLGRSMDGLPEPKNLMDEKSTVMVKAAGLRSWRQLIRGAKLVSFSFDGGQVTFTPSRNGGYGKAFLYLADQFHCPAVSEEMAATLLEAFDACRT